MIVPLDMAWPNNGMQPTALRAAADAAEGIGQRHGARDENDPPLQLHEAPASQVLYRLVTNYQTAYWNEDVFGLKKRPLILIDRRQSEEEMEELRRRYAFVDWEKTEAHMAGFDENALDLLLGN